MELVKILSRRAVAQYIQELRTNAQHDAEPEGNEASHNDKGKADGK